MGRPDHRPILQIGPIYDDLPFNGRAWFEDELANQWFPLLGEELVAELREWCRLFNLHFDPFETPGFTTDFEMQLMSSWFDFLVHRVEGLLPDWVEVEIGRDWIEWREPPQEHVDTPLICPQSPIEYPPRRWFRRIFHR